MSSLGFVRPRHVGMLPEGLLRSIVGHVCGVRLPLTTQEIRRCFDQLLADGGESADAYAALQFSLAGGPALTEAQRQVLEDCLTRQFWGIIQERERRME